MNPSPCRHRRQPARAAAALHLRRVTGPIWRAWLVCLAGLVLPPAVLAAAPAGEPALPAAVAARFADPATVYDTPGLRAGRDRYTGNDELRAWLRELAARPQGPRLLAAGRSAAGEAIEALQFSRGPGRPTVLLIGQQHGDEPAAAEALLVVAEMLASSAWAAWLERIDVVVLPRANPDGAALGLRWGRHGQDINRDHLLLQTPEAQALALLLRSYRPGLVVDVHEYPVLPLWPAAFGAMQGHDLLLQLATVPNLPPALADAGERWFRQPLLQALAREGLRADWYHGHSGEPGDRQLVMGGVQPDLLRNAVGLRNAIGILLESRGVGIGRAHLQRRVHSHVVAIGSLLASAARQATALTALREQLDAEVAGAACHGDAVLAAALTPTRREMAMLDPVTGADRSVAVLWASALELRPLARRARPCGYWLGAESGEAARRLTALGVTVQRLDNDAVLQAEGWRETLQLPSPRPVSRAGVDDGLGTRLIQATTVPRLLWAPAGSWWVPLEQPLAHLVMAALEPDTPWSWYAQRLLPALDSAARVTALPSR